MKRLFTILTVFACVFALAGVAFASNRVEVKVTSEPLQQFSTCDKAGGFSLQFDQNTRLYHGDQITVDLPLNVSLCKNIDMVVAPAPVRYTPPAAANVAVDSGWAGIGWSGTDTFTTPAGAVMLNAAAVATNKIIPTDDQGDSPIYKSNGSAIIGGLGDIIFRIVGVVGTQRVTVYVIGVSPNGLANTSNYLDLGIDAGTDTSTLTLRFLDQWTIAPTTPTTTSGIVASTPVPATDAASEFYQYEFGALWTDTAALSAAIDINGIKTFEQAAYLSDNTFCINVANYNAETVNVSMDSRADKYTFIPSNPQVAHIVAASTISYTNCKTATTGNILLPTTAQSSCSLIDYEGGSGYCKTAAGAAIHANNKVVFTSTTDYDMTTQYMARIQVLEPANAYIQYNEGVTLKIANDKDTVCGGGLAGATLLPKTYYSGTGSAMTTLTSTTNCVTSDTQRIRTMETGTGLLANTGKALWVDLPTFTYDTNVSAGQNLVVRVTLMKYPCGTIATADVTLGTFGCSSSTTGTSNLLFPYYTGIASSEAWWDGLVITNSTATAGTATITLYEADGDIATLAPVTISGYSQYVTLLSSVVDQLTQTAGTGDLGDSSCFIKVSCTFPSAAGFAMMGDGTQAQGYLAQ